MTVRPDPRVGTSLGPYRIERVLGRGGMGVVYLAEQPSLGRKVALKVLAPDLIDEAAFRQRFVRESQMAAAIDHPNILPIYEAGEIDGVYFLAMRYVEGTDLESRLRHGPLDPREAVSLIAQVASALDAANEAGLVHRDVKPANVLIAAGKALERTDHAYLTDFGLTKHRGSRTGLTQSGAFMGTLDYIAPEQVEGRDVDGRTDQYSLACVAFHCLTGRTPFPRDTDIAIAMAHLHDAPPSVATIRPEAAPDVDAVLARGMAKRPDDRFPTSEAFASALRQALGVRPTDRHVQPVASRRPRGAAIAVAAVGMLAVAAIGVWWLAGASTAQAPSQTGSVQSGAAEASLAARLPAEVATDCTSGSYAAQPNFEQANSSPGPAPEPVASIVCQVPTDAAAMTVYLQEYPGDAAGMAFVRQRLDDVAGQVGGLSLGDCASRDQAMGRWQHGDLLCFRNPAVGRTWLYWTEPEAQLLGAVSLDDLDTPGLFRWWSSAIGGLAAGGPVPSTTSQAAPESFPNIDEVRLIAAIPSELGADCQAGARPTLATAFTPQGPAGPQVKPRGHIDCRLAGGAGPDRIEGFSIPFTDIGAAGVVNAIGLERGATDGPCAVTGASMGVWPESEESHGSVTCFTDPTTGDGVIVWSDWDRTIFQAIAPDGDRQALRDWWLANAAALMSESP